MFNTKYTNLEYLIALNYFPNISPKRFFSLQKFFQKDYEKIFKATAKELTQAGWDNNLITKFQTWRRNFDLNYIIKKIKNHNIKTLDYYDPKYPTLLKQIYNPPFLLYYLGNLNTLENKCLAVVGSRVFSAYGLTAVNELVSAIADYKVSIVSGLAAGIDTLAHEIALKKQCATIAVLGSGLDKNSIYPYSNRNLVTKIENEQGLILSEFPPGTAPHKYNFPKRNRTMSGLCSATLVIEARQRSGALITAFHALEQNREVLAIPGGFRSELSKGPNNLIKQGAKMITEVEDILEVLNIKNKNISQQTTKIINLTENEKKIYDALSANSLPLHELKQKINLNISEINSGLSTLEIKGLITKNNNSEYLILWDCR